MSPLAGWAALGGAAGTMVGAPIAMISDAGWAVLGGVATAIVTTAGSVMIAFINRPSRNRAPQPPAAPPAPPPTPPKGSREPDRKDEDEPSP